MLIRKVDSNQKEIVQAFEQAGASVVHLHTVGHGTPDLAIGYAGVTVLVEIKSRNGKLTDDETRFFQGWRGAVRIVRDCDDVMDLLEIIRLGGRLA